MKLNREILRLSGPSILANITVPLVGMVDIAVVGHLGAAGGVSGASFIGGISVGTMLFDLLYWNFGFLRAGTGGLTAQAYGRLQTGNPGAKSALNAPGESFSGNPGAKLALNAPGESFSGNPGAKSARFAPEIGSILGRALRIAMVSGLALIALQWVVVQLAFLVVQCSPEVRMLATQYFYIRIWAAPATLSLFALKGWFIGLQDSLRPMLVDLWVNGVNMLLFVLLAFGLVLPAGSLLPSLGTGIASSAGDALATLGTGVASSAGRVLVSGMGFAGVAWGTVLAQWTGLFLALFVTRKYLSLSHLLKFLVRNRDEKYQQSADTDNVSNHGHEAKTVDGGRYEAQSFDGGRVGAEKTPEGAALIGHRPSFFTLNRDLFLRSVGMIAVYIGFTVLSARLGDLMLAVSTILMKFLMIFSYFTDGFAYAGEALTGRFIGERSLDGVRSTARGTFAWGFGLAAVFMLLYGLGGTPLFRLMTADTTVVEAGRQFIPWLLVMPLIGCPAFTWDGIFIGATASKDLRNSTLLCALGFFAVWFSGRWLANTFNPGSLGMDGIGMGAPDMSMGNLSPEIGLHILMAAYFTHLVIRALYLTLRYRPAILQPLS